MKVHFFVDDAAVNECPRSFVELSLGPEQKGRFPELVRIHLRAKSMETSMGKLMFGPDESQWPAWLFDAMNVLTSEENAVEAAMEEHKQRNRRR